MGNMRQFRDLCVGLFFVALSVACIALSVALITFPKRLLSELARQGDLTRAVIDRQLTGTQNLVDRHLSSFRVDAKESLDAAARGLDYRLLSIQRDMAVSLSETNSILDRNLSEANRSIAFVAVPLGGATQQVNDALPLWLDCDHNPDCLFNRTQPVLKGMESASKVFTENFPPFVNSLQSTAVHIDQTSANIEKITADLAKPSPWYKKAVYIFTGLGNAARVVR